MSMYTQLLHAAFGLQPGIDAQATHQLDAVAEVQRCRGELHEGVPPGLDPDTVPLVLALQIGYDVALLRLAKVVGIESGPERFEQPQLERQRLETELAERGIEVGGSHEDTDAEAGALADADPD
jgi:hypothetical protein